MMHMRARIQHAEDGGSSTLTELATDRMVEDIVYGRLEPGSKLRIDELKARYKMGASPLREGLTRLISLGFVTNETRRGFRVATISYNDLAEITEVRKLIELRALELSIRNGGKEWEEQVVVQMARLRHAVQKLPQDEFPAVLSFDTVHEDFHRALVFGCGSPRLIGLQETYYDLAKRYRVLVFQTPIAKDDFLDRHEVLTQIVLDRKLDEACAELSRHLDLLVSNLSLDDSHKLSSMAQAPCQASRSER